MNIASTTGAIASAAASTLSQSAGAETERSAKDSASRERTAASEALSEKASGIGQTQEDGGTTDRDADGRRAWEIDARKKKQAAAAEQEHHDRRAKDPTGVSGASLDLSG